MLDLAQRHSNELNGFDGRLSLTTNAPVDKHNENEPFYMPNAYDYWNYYLTFVKDIRFSKRDLIAELLYLAGHSISANNGNVLAKTIIQQHNRLVYTVPSSGVYWDSLNNTHEEFLSYIRDYKSKNSLLDVLQETRRCKVEEVTRFCHKLINIVREFIESDDLDNFNQDKRYKIMMMASLEDQEIDSILKKFNLNNSTNDPEIDYYLNSDFSPTKLLIKLIKDLTTSSAILEMKNKIVFINKVSDLICLIRRSFIEHLTNIHPRTFVEVKLL